MSRIYYYHREYYGHYYNGEQYVRGRKRLPYQPSEAGGTRSTPAKPQRRGGLTLQEGGTTSIVKGVE